MNRATTIASRLDNLRSLAAQAGSHAALAKRLGRTRGWLSQLIGANPTKAISEGIARDIEAKLGLTDGALDQAWSATGQLGRDARPANLKGDPLLARQLGRLVEDFLLASPSQREQLLQQASKFANHESNTE